MTERTITKRGNIVPLAEYSDGTTGLAWPEVLHSIFDAASTLQTEEGQYRPGTGDERGVQLATQAAGGAMGGGSLISRPAASLAANNILPRDVISWFQRAGVPVEKTQTASTGSTYIHARDPNAAKGAPGSRVEVRIPPEDGHGGRILPRDVLPGNYFDTTPEAPKKSFDRILAPRVNRAGEQYSDREALFDALKWRTSRSPDGQFLIPPDRAPSVQAHRSQTQPAAKPIEGPDLTPDQLKLLSSGDPAALLAFAESNPDDPRSRLIRAMMEGQHAPQ